MYFDEGWVNLKGKEFCLGYKKSEKKVNRLIEGMTEKVRLSKRKKKNKVQVLDYTVKFEFVNKDGQRIIFEAVCLEINI